MRSFSLFLFLLALVVVQALIGGARQVFGLPAYVLLGLSGLALVLVRPRMDSGRQSCLLLAVALAGWVAVRGFLSPVDYLARNDLFMVVGALLVYLSVTVYYTGQRSRLIIVGVLIACVLFHSVVGAIQFKHNDDFMLLPGIMRPSYGWRASGFYICPNHLAGLLEMMGMMILGLVVWAPCRLWLRILLGYGVLVCFAAQAITGSRGGYLSIVFGLAVFTVLSLWIMRRQDNGRFWMTLALAIVGSAILVGGLVFVMTKSDTLAARLAQVYEPTNMRPLMWRAALTQFQLNPVAGTGAGTYLYYGRQFRSPLVQNDPIHVHNDYLELLAEYGLIGIILCGAFVIFHWWGGLVGIRKAVDTRLRPSGQSLDTQVGLAVGALSAIAALLLHSIVDFNLHIPANTLIISVLFAFLANPGGEPRSEPSKLAKPGMAFVRWFTFGISLALLLLSLRLLPGEICAERARVALRDDRYEEALTLAERGLQWDKRNPNLYAYVGEAKHFLTLKAATISMQQAFHEESAEAYRDGLQLFPRDTGMLLKLGQTLDLLGRFAEANDVYERAFECDPNFGNVYAYYGRHCQMQRRYKAAERYFRRALQNYQWPIAVEGLQSIERMKQDPVAQTLMSLSEEPDDDAPVPAGVLRP